MAMQTDTTHDRGNSAAQPPPRMPGPPIKDSAPSSPVASTANSRAAPGSPSPTTRCCSRSPRRNSRRSAPSSCAAVSTGRRAASRTSSSAWRNAAWSAATPARPTRGAWTSVSPTPARPRLPRPALCHEAAVERYFASALSEEQLAAFAAASSAILERLEQSAPSVQHATRSVIAAAKSREPVSRPVTGSRRARPPTSTTRPRHS